MCKVPDCMEGCIWMWFIRLPAHRSLAARWLLQSSVHSELTQSLLLSKLLASLQASQDLYQQEQKSDENHLQLGMMRKLAWLHDITKAHQEWLDEWMNTLCQPHHYTHLISFLVALSLVTNQLSHNLIGKLLKVRTLFISCLLSSIVYWLRYRAHCPCCCVCI